MPTGRRSRPCRCGRGGAGRGWVGGSGCQAAGGAGVASPATAAARHAACALGIPPNTLTHIARHAMRAALAPLQPAPPPYSSPSLGAEELEGHSSEIRVDLVFCVRQVHQLAHLALHGGVITPLSPSRTRLRSSMIWKLRSAKYVGYTMRGRICRVCARVGGCEGMGGCSTSNGGLQQRIVCAARRTLAPPHLDDRMGDALLLRNVSACADLGHHPARRAEGSYSMPTSAPRSTHARARRPAHARVATLLSHAARPALSGALGVTQHGQPDDGRVAADRLVLAPLVCVHPQRL